MSVVKDWRTPELLGRHMIVSNSEQIQRLSEKFISNTGVWPKTYPQFSQYCLVDPWPLMFHGMLVVYWCKSWRKETLCYCHQCACDPFISRDFWKTQTITSFKHGHSPSKPLHCHPKLNISGIKDGVRLPKENEYLCLSEDFQIIPLLHVTN